MRAATFDIETTSLDAVGAGFVLCVVVKPLGRMPKVFRLDEIKGCKSGHEKPLLERVFAELSQFDLLIGHYCEKFDWKYLKSRAWRESVPMISPPLAYDTHKAWKRVGALTQRNKFGGPTAALDHVVDFLSIAQDKTKIYPANWWAAVWDDGTKRTKAMNQIVAHCVADVKMTELAYEAILPQDARATIKRFQ